MNLNKSALNRYLVTLSKILSSNVIVLVSKKDEAGMNMKEYLLSTQEYEIFDLPQIPENWPDGEYEVLKNDTHLILTIPEHQIYADYLEGYLDTKLVIFASKHSAASGKKALLVHTTGILGPEAGWGGNDNEVAVAPSKILYTAYHKIKQLQEAKGLDEYWTGIEVTHHGPSALSYPLIFIETGGTEEEWRDKNACYLIGEVIAYLIDMVNSGEMENYEKSTFIGIGGTHYGARYISKMDKELHYMGHILPKYSHDIVADTIIDEVWNKTLGKDKFFMIDKKGCNSKNRNKFIALIEKSGYPWEYA